MRLRLRAVGAAVSATVRVEVEPTATLADLRIKGSVATSLPAETLKLSLDKKVLPGNNAD
jgi:hypothetical protein